MEKASGIREPVYAGSFYPADAAQLKTLLSSLFEEAGGDTPSDPRKPAALIVPHAGYIYSGLVAARAYRETAGRDYKRILMIGPYHYNSSKGEFFRGVAPALYSRLRSPLGDINYDATTAEKLHGLLNVSFMQQAHSLEHSLEVQLPFVAKGLPGIPVSMLLVGQFDLRDTTSAAKAVTEILDDDTLVVISTDLSHYHPYEEARTLDAKSLSLIEEGDIQGLFNWDRSMGGMLCGIGGVLTIMQVAKSKEWAKPVQLAYMTSGDRGGGKREVVGYASYAYYKG